MGLKKAIFAHLLDPFALPVLTYYTYAALRFSTDHRICIKTGFFILAIAHLLDVLKDLTQKAQKTQRTQKEQKIIKNKFVFVYLFLRLLRPLRLLR